MAKRKDHLPIIIFQGLSSFSRVYMKYIHTYTPNMYFHQVHISDIDTMFMIYSVVNEILDVCSVFIIFCVVPNLAVWPSDRKAALDLGGHRCGTLGRWVDETSCA